MTHRSPHRPKDEDPDEAMLPVEPDEGPGPPAIPEDPEKDRTADPEA